MKKLTLILFFVPIFWLCNGQSEIAIKNDKADSLLKVENYLESYTILKEIYPKISKKDPIYSTVLWNLGVSSTALEYSYRFSEKYDTALVYAMEALKFIETGIPIFGEKFAVRKYWMHKNLLVSYFELKNLKKFEEEKSFLYKSYAAKKLPEGIDEYFNFSYFKWKDKNIWGYEWFLELPDDRWSSSFTKIVYYVYSTNEDGGDKDQLFRFHVLMFHQSKKDAKFDYILERQMEVDDNLVSGSYYSYLYSKKIDYVKLKKDIIEILKKDIQPDSKRVMKNKLTLPTEKTSPIHQKTI